MNLFERFFKVVQANVNSVLRSWEDPEKVLTQAVEDSQRDLVKVRQSYAEVMASQKRMQRQRDQAEGLSAFWRRRAGDAVRAGDDPLATEALQRKALQDRQVAGLDRDIAAQTENLDKLFEAMQALERKIAEARSVKDQYVARARTAKTTARVNDMLSATGTGASSVDAIERMKAKVDMLEAEAEISGELAAGATAYDVDAKFRQLEASAAVEDELERMKARMLPDSATRRGGAPVPPVDPAVEAELKKLKQDLGLPSSS